MQGQDRVIPQRPGLIDAVSHVIDEMDGGRASTFAARVGIAKSTVHHWLQQAGTPTLDMTLRIAAHSGISLSKLLQGDLQDWKAPQLGQQMGLPLPSLYAKSRVPPRVLDWEHIERALQALLKLPTPIPVLEAARLPPEVLSSVPHLFDVLRDVQESLIAEQETATVA